MTAISLAAPPLVVPAVGFALSDRDRGRFAVWLLVSAFVVASLLFAGLVLMFPPSSVDVRYRHLFAVVSALIAFLIGFLGTLLAVRACGYRLERRGLGENDALQQEKERLSAGHC